MLVICKIDAARKIFALQLIVSTIATQPRSLVVINVRVANQEIQEESPGGLSGRDVIS